MNPKTGLLKLTLALLLLTPGLRAGAMTHEAILKERETVLAKIVAETESRYTVGTKDDKDVWQAKLALYSFRRDNAPTVAEKRPHQERIVALHEQQLAMFKARAQAGIADSLEVLRATDALLAAQQLLVEMSPGAK